jgi:hypothetical protein
MHREDILHMMLLEHEGIGVRAVADDKAEAPEGGVLAQQVNLVVAEPARSSGRKRLDFRTSDRPRERQRAVDLPLAVDGKALSLDGRPSMRGRRDVERSAPGLFRPRQMIKFFG